MWYELLTDQSVHLKAEVSKIKKEMRIKTVFHAIY